MCGSRCTTQTWMEQVRVLTHEQLPAVRHAVTFEAGGPASGTYIVRMETSHYIQVETNADGRPQLVTWRFTVEIVDGWIYREKWWAYDEKRYSE